MSNIERYAYTSWFPEGTFMEVVDATRYIYHPSEMKRWMLSSYCVETLNQRISRMAVQVKISGGDWHTLLGAHWTKDPETGAEIDTLIYTQIIQKSVNPEEERNCHVEYFYAPNFGSTLYPAFGHYIDVDDTLEQIHNDLKTNHGAAPTIDQLPKKIDVYGTVDQLIDAFSMGKFEARVFVIPSE